MASSTPDPVARLRDMLAGKAEPKTQSKKKRRTYNIDPARRSSRLFTGISLRACARKAAGKELSPLEEQMLAMYKIWADEKVIAALGNEFNQHKRSRAAGQSMFPEVVLQLHDDEPYTREHLLRDVRKLAPEIAAQPENQMVPIESILDGTIDSKEYIAALGKIGSGVTLFTTRPLRAKRSDATESTDQNGSASGSASDETIQVKEEKSTPTVQSHADLLKSVTDFPLELVFDRMHCWSGQEGEHRTDEIYAAYGAASDGPVLSYQKTREYEYIVPGTTTKFDAGTKLFSSTFRLTFNAHLEVWESDHSDDPEYDKMIQELHEMADNLNQAAIEGMESEEENDGAAVMSLLAAILDGIAAILYFFKNLDDLLCTRTLGFDRAGIAALSKAPNAEMAIDFPGSIDDSGDWTGSHTVYIRSTKGTPPCGGVATTGVDIAGDSLKVSANKSVQVNSKYGMGLTCFKGQVVGIYGRGHEGNTMVVSAPISANPDSWSEPYNFRDNLTRSRPSLTVIGSTLHVCFPQATDNVVRWFQTDDLKNWSRQVFLDKFPDHDHYALSTVTSVTSAGFKDQLFVMARNQAGDTIYLKQDPKSTTAAPWKYTAWRSDYGPSLIVFEDKLYCFTVNLFNRIALRVYNPDKDQWNLTLVSPFCDEIFSCLACSVSGSTIIIAFRNIHGTPTVGTLTGLAEGMKGGSQPVWKTQTLDTQGVGDPDICKLTGTSDALLLGWSMAYYDM